MPGMNSCLSVSVWLFLGMHRRVAQRSSGRDLTDMSDEFTREIVKRSVARACLALDYKSAQASVLESLTDVIDLYVKTLGTLSQENAELAGRPNAGIHDFISVLDNQKAIAKTSWTDLRTFAFGGDPKTGQDTSSVWKQPFPLDIPSYPVGVKPITQPRQSEPAAGGGQLIAKHLPPFPPSHTYKRSALDSNSKKRSSADVEADGTFATARRVKRIHASKTIQQSIARLDRDNDTLTTGASSSSSAVFEGPALGQDAGNGSAGAAAGHGRGGVSSLRVVLDGDSSFVDSLPKEEKLLLGVDVTGGDEAKN